MTFHEHQVKAFELWVEDIATHGQDFGPWFYWFEAAGLNPIPPPFE